MPSCWGQVVLGLGCGAEILIMSSCRMLKDLDWIVVFMQNNPYLSKSKPVVRVPALIVNGSLVRVYTHCSLRNLWRLIVVMLRDPKCVFETSDVAQPTALPDTFSLQNYICSILALRVCPCVCVCVCI